MKLLQNLSVHLLLYILIKLISEVSYGITQTLSSLQIGGAGSILSQPCSQYFYFYIVFINDKIQVKLVNMVYRIGHISVTCFFSSMKLETYILLCLISSPDPKGHVSFCYHWASNVRR